MTAKARDYDDSLSDSLFNTIRCKLCCVVMPTGLVALADAADTVPCYQGHNRKGLCMLFRSYHMYAIYAF